MFSAKIVNQGKRFSSPWLPATGVKKNSYYTSLVQNEVTMDALFKV
jgi:hypothetical protein